MDTPTRRTLLGSGVVLLSSLAGCSTFRTERRTEVSGSETATAALDLREADVPSVAIEAQGDGDYRFDVTLYHDDDGEDGYANWWQVETLAGEQLGRRDLLHAHSTDPFTRSESITIPDGVDCVVVRGHDQTHSYGGQAMTVGLPDGETNQVQQGPDRHPIAERNCP